MLKTISELKIKHQLYMLNYIHGLKLIANQKDILEEKLYFCLVYLVESVNHILLEI